MTEDQEKLLLKIKKLMAKAQDPSVTESEAAAFAAKARQMLIDNKLSEASLDEVSLERNPFGYERVDVAARYNVAKWKIDLFFAVARYNFCRAVHSQSSKGHNMNLLGKQQDREIVIFLYDQLVAKIEALSKSEVKKAVQRGEVDWMWRGPRHPSQWQFSFCNGAVSGVKGTLRLEYERQKAGQDGEATMSLIVLSDNEVQSYMDTVYPPRSLGQFRMSGSMHNSSAYVQGQVVGQGIDVVRGGVNSGTSQKKVGPG